MWYTSVVLREGKRLGVVLSQSLFTVFPFLRVSCGVHGVQVARLHEKDLLDPPVVDVPAVDSSGLLVVSLMTRLLRQNHSRNISFVELLSFFN